MHCNAYIVQGNLLLKIGEYVNLSQSFNGYVIYGLRNSISYIVDVWVKDMYMYVQCIMHCACPYRKVLKE